MELKFVKYHKKSTRNSSCEEYSTSSSQQKKREKKFLPSLNSAHGALFG